MAKPYRQDGVVWLKVTGERLNMNWFQVSYRDQQELKDQVTVAAKRIWHNQPITVDISTLGTHGGGSIFTNGQDKPSARFGIEPGKLPEPVPATEALAVWA